MRGELAAAYKSGCQSARIVTESWGAINFYCPNCSSPKLDWLRAGYKASDYSCPSCKSFYQLKSQRARIGNYVNDGDYETMIKAMRRDETPSFYFMQYDFATWSVRNLLLVPHFAFPPSAIVKRNPTTPKGRKNPWVGCNIALNRIPADARISLVTEKQVIPATEVRAQFHKVKPFKEFSITKRGWMLDVLNIVHRLGKTEFTNQDVYAFERELERLHSGNRHIRDKIRQQLQVLRDLGFLTHIAHSEWRLK